MSSCILLTSCWRLTNADKKREYYIKAITQWLETDLPIFIVESSGYTFPEFKDTRLKVCSFNLEGLASSSQYEARSILYAMDYFKEDMKNYTHIFKITARYFLDVTNKLTFIDEDIILQHQCNDSIEWNNSEIFGFKNGLEHEILDAITDLGYMEHRIYQFAKTHKHGRLPPLVNINNVKRGGDGLIVSVL